jgi:hypothetical protein
MKNNMASFMVLEKRESKAKLKIKRVGSSKNRASPFVETY